MVDSVNGASFANNPVYQYHYEQWQIMKKKYGTDMSFTRYLRQLNVDFDMSMQGVENLVETGDWNKGDGIDGNTINYNRHVDGENKNNQMYQTDDMEGFYEIDWESGTYNKTDREGAAKALGLGYGFDYDTIVFGNGVAEITDFTFGNLDDGQDRNEYNLEGVYKNITYAIQEFDPCYLVDSSLSNPNDPEYQKAMKNWEYLCATATQWMSASDYEELAGLDENSAEYKNKIISIILDRLDQMKAFNDHDHVEYSGDVTDPGKDSAVDGSTDGTNSEKGTETLNYNRTDVIKASGLFNDYMTGTNWTGQWFEDGGRSNRRENRNKAIVEGRNYISQTLDAVISNLKAQAGDSWTDEMAKYAESAKDEMLFGFVDTSEESICDNGTIKSGSVWGATDCKKGGAQDARAVVKINTLLDNFFSKFDSLCKSGGKTQAEIDAAKKEKEELKDNYKTFYNLNIKGSDIRVDNVKSEYTVSMTGGNYKQDAKNNVLTPYSEKIMSVIKSKCPKLSESQIQTVLDSAMSYALSDSSWVSANGNIATGGTYTINTDKLVESFGSYIKQAITKVSGYEP